MGVCMDFGSLFSKEAREFWINLNFIKVFPNKKISNLSLKDLIQVIPLWFEMITATMLKKISRMNDIWKRRHFSDQSFSKVLANTKYYLSINLKSSVPCHTVEDF